MSRRQLYGDLNAVRALVADGLSHLDGTAGDLDPHRLDSVRGRLRSVDGFLAAAAGGVGRLPGVAVGAVATFLVGWATAAATTAFGFAPVWVIVCTVPVAVLTDLLMTMPARRIGFALGDAVNRRRLTRADRPTRAGRRGDRGLDTGEFGAGEVAAALEPLLRARVRLVSAALRQVDSRRWRSPYLSHLAAEHRSIGRIAEADLLLCQAINYLEIYLDEHTKEPG